MDELAAAAASLGIELDYVDALGQRQVVERADLERIVRAFGNAGEGAPRVIVLRDGEPRDLTLREYWVAFRWTVTQDTQVRAQGEGHDGRADLPALAHGVYRLRIDEHAGASEEMPLLAAPRTAYRPEFSAQGKRGWLLAVQLYGVRSRRNWGHGDFTDAADLIAALKPLGAAGLGLNPLHALFPDRPEDASPYAPNSRLFLNPLYIDVEAVPDFPGVDILGIGEEIARLRAAPLVDYAGVARVKIRALRAAYDNFRAGAEAPRRADFTEFRRARGDTLARFAAFETLRAKHPGPWWEWPERWRRPDAASIAALRRTQRAAMGFQEYLQWIADRQLAACAMRARAIGLAVGLYLDMAVGVEPGGADAWSEQASVVSGLNVGAPPDALNRAGQDWGLASFSPRALAASQFQLFRETLRAVMRHSGAVRLDHVLGLNRVYLIPAGAKPGQGSYVRFPLQAMLAVVAQESTAARCLVIGEDLGTVPDGFRELMADWNVWSYRLTMFERGHDGAFHAPEHYPRDALVAFDTHDLATFAGWMAGHDLGVKRALGLDPGETDAERDAARAALARAVGCDPPGFLEVMRMIARSPSGILAVEIEDVLGEVEQINVPGTTHEHPNWRRRWPMELEDVLADQRLRALAKALAEAGRALD